MVKPILIYGCQVWSERLLTFFQKEDFGNFDKLPFEQLQNRLCKYALKVGNKSSNMAARAELGIYPILLTIAQSVISYWLNILQSPNKLVYSAYCEDRHLDSKGQKNWVTLVRTILTRCNLERTWDAQPVNNTCTIVRQVRSKLEEQFKRNFFKSLSSTTGKTGKSGNKLRTYNIIKDTYKSEKYLSLDLPLHIKRALTQIRISAHTLEIEQGRMAKPQPIPPDKRFCKHCKDKLEDELHFITECTLYKQLRIEMLRACPPEFQIIKDKPLFQALFKTTNETVIYQLGVYICRAMARRKCFLYV